MSTRMPAPRIVAYTASTGRALVDCGQHVVWMTAADAEEMRKSWRDLTVEIRDKNAAVDAIVNQL